jgi:hypothetical protein
MSFKFQDSHNQDQLEKGLFLIKKLSKKIYAVITSNKVNYKIL